MKGDLPTRMVIPASKPSDISAKVGYLGLKMRPENNQVDYSKYKINQ